MTRPNYTSVHHLLDGSFSISPSKEGEPSKQHQEVSHIEPGIISEQEPQIRDKEVAAYMKLERHEPSLDPRLIKAGLSEIDTISLDPRQSKHMPISDVEIMKGLDMPINSSWRWFSIFLMYLLKKAHIALKIVHGHVVRILIR